jgi:hypothetical protein
MEAIHHGKRSATSEGSGCRRLDPRVFIRGLLATLVLALLTALEARS